MIFIGRKIRWSDADTETAARLLSEKADEAAFKRLLGRTRVSAQQRVAYVTSDKVRKQTAARNRYQRQCQSGVVIAPQIFVPDEVLRDAARRNAMSRTLTAEFFGDPVPGYSALDRRNSPSPQTEAGA